MAMQDLRPIDLREDLSYATQCNDGCSDQSERQPPTSTNDVPDYRYPRAVKLVDYDPNTLNTCPWAKASLVQNRATGAYAVRGITCKRWNCGPCARAKIRNLAWWVKLACPNKLLTLTVDPALHDNPELRMACDGTKGARTYQESS